MENIYLKERLKKIFKVLFVTIVIIIILWSCVFLIDYVMYKKRKQTIFTITKVENVNDEYVTTQKGLAYKYVIKNGKAKLYIFGKEI